MLGLAREHRRAAVVLKPRASRYAFTLIEFALLTQTVTRNDLAPLSDIPRENVPERMAAIVTVLASRRGFPPVLSSSDELDVPDPFGGPRASYEASSAKIDRTCATIDEFMAHALAL
jgi:protein-tyrosine phosphatase